MHTIISPTSLTRQYSDVFMGWTLFVNTREDTGYLQLLNDDGINHAKLQMFNEGGLWYHYIPTNIQGLAKPTICKLSTKLEFELWHHRLGHPNSTVLQNMHHYARGVP